MIKTHDTTYTASEMTFQIELTKFSLVVIFEKKLTNQKCQNIDDDFGSFKCFKYSLKPAISIQF